MPPASCLPQPATSSAWLPVVLTFGTPSPHSFLFKFLPPPPGFILTYLIVRAFLAAHGIVRLHRDLRTLQSQLEGSCSLTRDRARGPPVLGVQSLGLWITRKVPRSFFRMKKGGHSSLSTRNLYSRRSLDPPLTEVGNRGWASSVTSPRPPVGARQSGQRAAPARDARPGPSISVTAFFPGGSLLGFWTVAKEVCVRGQKEDFCGGGGGPAELLSTEPLPRALRTRSR